MPRALAYILLTIAGGGAVLHFALPSSRETKSPSSFRQNASTAKPPSPPAEPELPSYQPEVGKRYIYTFERKIGFSTNAPWKDISFHGEFYLDVVKANSSSFTALISEKMVEAGSKISAPLKIEVSARGDSLSLFTGENSDQDYLPVAKDLLSLWIFPLSEDTVGRYTARFETLPTVIGLQRKQKSKLSYSASTPQTPKLIASKHILLWNTELHIPSQIEGSETTQLGSSSQGLTSESSYTLRLSAVKSIPANSEALLATLDKKEDLALNNNGKAPREYESNLNWQQMLAALKDLSLKSESEQLNTFGDLLRYLKAHPGQSSALASLLLDPKVLALGPQSPLFKTLVGALATSASPEALAILREAYSDSNILPAGKGTILAALTTTQAALDAATRDFLLQRSSAESDPRLSQGAAFALGSALQQANDSSASKAIQQIRQSWEASLGNIPQALAWLDVMGNSGRSEFLPTLQSAMQESNPALRARAVFALRFVKDASATSALFGALGDADASVREAAANALAASEWQEKYRSPLETCAHSEAIPATRELCQKILANHSQLAAQ